MCVKCEVCVYNNKKIEKESIKIVDRCKIDSDSEIHIIYGNQQQSFNKTHSQTCW